MFDWCEYLIPNVAKSVFGRESGIVILSRRIVSGDTERAHSI